VTQVVLDASAAIALMLGEPGADAVAMRMSTGSISSVNIAEVVGYLAKKGASEVSARAAIGRLNLRIELFTATDAVQAGLWRPLGETVGLSLGDRACLALAKRLSLPVLTSDRAWATIAPALGVKVELIR
jgi:ribonuclease VapC